MMLPVLVLFASLFPFIFGHPTNALSTLLRREEGDEPYIPPTGCEAACQAFPDNRVTAGTCFDAYALTPDTAPEQSCCTAPVFSSFHDCAACIARVQSDVIDLPSADYILTNFNEIIGKCNEGGSERLPTLSLLSSRKSGDPSNGAISRFGWTMHAAVATSILVLSSVIF